MFEKYIQDAPLELNPKDHYLFIDNEVSLQKRLFNIDNLSDQDLYKVIYDSYNGIIKEVDSKNVELINFLYRNARFIMTFTNVLSRPDIELNHLQKISVNKLAYDYFTARGNKDNYIRALLLNMVKTVNRSVMPGMIGLGLNEDIAAYLVNARYSTEKSEDIQIRRLNLEIMKCSSEVMTVQMIVNIYGKLFDHVLPLFSAIMYDHWPNDSFVNNEMEDIYATINLAILEIVNNLPEDIMYQLLVKFKETYDLMNHGQKLRFNIYSFCEADYPRLGYMLQLLRQDGITMPV